MAAVFILLRPGAAHREHILVVKVVELPHSLVITVAGTLHLTAFNWK